MALFSEPMRCKELWETNTNLLLTTIVESRRQGLQFLNVGNGKESIESGKCIGRKCNESVFNDISSSF